ncbi:MAG: biotin--[acetyl-CoA-carboxylase] ligase, partial [Undibacterium sp.]|nr:biotin--[acetyl-CoA-carboxylase] ligase [Undibacterium sp.]
FAERWNNLHAHAGQAVMVLDRGQVLHEGLALGVDHSGCLVLQTAQGQATVVAGDVSLRPAPAN